MNKLCEFFKKYDGIIGILCFALLAVYALCMATPAAPCLQYEDTKDFYDQMMAGNDLLIYLSIFGIVWSVIYSTLRNRIRKVYYVSNFVWHGVYIVFAIVCGILVISTVANYQNLYLQLPIDEMNAYWIRLNPSNPIASISADTPVFLLGYLLAGLIILSAVPVGFVCGRHALTQLKQKKAKEAEAQE